MKKTLLIASAALVGIAANAQEPIVAFATQEDQERVGINGSDLTDEQVAVPFVESEAGDFYLAFADKWKSGAAYDKYSKVKINGGDEIALPKYGAVGNANPTFVSYQEGAQSAGAVFKIEAKKDGYVTVFTKLAGNKAFVVMEGQMGDISYRLGYANATTVFQYELPHDEDGYLDFSVNPDNRYFAAAQKQGRNEEGVLLWNGQDGVVAQDERPTWQVEDGTNEDGTPKYVEKQGSPYMVDIEPRQDKPSFPYQAAGLESNPGNGTVFVTFPVIGPDPEAGYMEGNTYYISALGSKVPMGGFIFTENEPTITYCGTSDLPEVTFVPGKDPIIGENAVESINAASADAPIYNMMGVRVN
ncbi:MAG: hypothetical protein K2K25_07895, partial [Muribaculaceae bacterium]|nr:hypothetical protein [Muribaculaceae bacterium]